MRGAVLTAEAEIEVPFQDLDPMDIAWHGNYFRYFEAARVKLLRSIGYDYPAMKASGYSWPRPMRIPLSLRSVPILTR